jgi:hypothetical protein
MKSIDRERVLRLNCPGFGEESHLNLGRAKSLDNYQVIIANPVSLLHLFDKGPEPTRRINQLLSEGVNQLNVPDDALIQELINESDARLEELIPFLSQGGLLIYFLCRPFVLAGPTISVDNYDWLSVYAPATKNPPDNGSRQMSALSHGRVIETTDEGNTSEMAEYLNQSSIEWNTIIRTDFLSSNYSVLATAAQKKCIAAQFWAGDNGGKVIFLPAPYSPDFDRVLMTCVNKWYQEALDKGYIKGSEAAPVAAPSESRPGGPDFYSESQPQASGKTMDEARLEEIMANLAANHQKSDSDKAQAEAIKEQSETGALELASTTTAAESVPMPAKQPPKGALKGLFSSDALGDDDDDDFSTPLPVTKVSAEEILSSVSAEVDKQTSAFQEMEAIPAAAEDAPEPVMSGDNSSIDVESVPVVSESEAAPETPNNFELKKATAEMDLSMFAETARQLVQKANQIETATRDPNVVSGANPKQKISDILKGLEFGGNTSIDDLDAEFAEPEANAPAAATPGANADSEAARLMQTLDPAFNQASEESTGLNNSLINLLNPANNQANEVTETQISASGDMTDAERERAEIESSSKSLESFLRPESAEVGMGGRNNTPPVDFAAEEARIEKERVEAQRIAAEQAEQARLETQRLLAEQAEIARIEAEREAAKMANFRETFEFLKDEDPVAREYQPESILKEAQPKTADELQEVARAESSVLFETSSIGVPSMQNATGVSSMQTQALPEITPVQAPQPEQVQGIYEGEEPRSSLRSLMKTVGAPRLEPAANLNMFDNPQSTETHESLPQVPSQQFSTYSDDSLEPAPPTFEAAQSTQPTQEAEEQVLNTQFTPVSDETEAAAPVPAVNPQANENKAPAPFNPASPAQPQAEFPNPALNAPQAVPPPLQPTPTAYNIANVSPAPAPAYEPPQIQAPAQPAFAEQPFAESPAQAPQPAMPAQPAAQMQPPAEPAAVEAPQTPPLTSATLFASLAQQSMRGTNGDHRAAENDPAATPQPKELIKKMEEMTKTAPPTWCDEFSFPFIDLLKNEHMQVSEQIRQMQSRLSSVETRIRAVDTLKVILLTGENDALMNGAQEVLSRLGWQVQQSRSNANELWLSHGENVEAIARIVHGPGAANRTEVAQLAESVIAFWDEYETEPKGILIAQTWSAKHPSERTEPDFSPALQEFASKKHLSLMSTMQLLSMYKDVELSTMPVDEMRKRMLETSGRLLGFPLDTNVAQAASGAR